MWVRSWQEVKRADLGVPPLEEASTDPGLGSTGWVGTSCRWDSGQVGVCRLRAGEGCSRLTGDRGVAGHGLGRRVIVAVRAVEEGLSALAGGHPGVQHEPRAGLRVQRAAARGRRRPIFSFEAVR